MKQLVIFDLDGTLLNTIEDLGEACNYALKETGFPQHALTSYPNFVGNGVTRLIERIIPEDHRSEHNIEKLLQLFRQYYDNHNTDRTVPYPGIPELLKGLTDRGIKVAVASNKYQSATERIISHFFPEIPWVAIEGQKDDFPIKPDPSIVFDILSKSPTPKSDTLYVGDSGVDMETARRACVSSVGVSWGFRPLKELREFYAETIVSRPSEILEIALK